MVSQQNANMESTPSASASVRIWELLALAVSVAALAGSLYLSMGMKLKACPLCLYERTFMMGLVGVLLIGLTGSRCKTWILSHALFTVGGWWIMRGSVSRVP